MTKIKAIQKGTGEEAIYFRTFKTTYEIENNIDRKYMVDSITTDFEISKFKEGQEIKEKQLIYKGFKNKKLVFTMTNDNLTVWYE